MNPVASKIAVDVALLPPPEVMELAIGLNQKLELETGQKQTVALGTKDFLPHLSLAMGIIKADQADQTVAALQRAISEIRPLDLEIEGLQVVESVMKASILAIRMTDQLRDLHERVMEVAEGHFSYDEIQPAMYLAPPEPSEKSCNYLKRFCEEHAFDNFAPHITLGKGVVSGEVSPQQFVANRVALCRLGISNSCRKILGEISLGRIQR